jgi:hypothetical protein
MPQTRHRHRHRDPLPTGNHLKAATARRNYQEPARPPASSRKDGVLGRATTRHREGASMTGVVYRVDGMSGEQWIHAINDELLKIPANRGLRARSPDRIRTGATALRELADRGLATLVSAGSLVFSGFPRLVSRSRDGRFRLGCVPDVYRARSPPCRPVRQLRALVDLRPADAALAAVMRNLAVNSAPTTAPDQPATKPSRAVVPQLARRQRSFSPAERRSKSATLDLMGPLLRSLTPRRRSTRPSTRPFGVGAHGDCRPAQGGVGH